MAAIASPWAKPGAWALDSEEHEVKLQKYDSERSNSNRDTEQEADFPSLEAAAASKTSKKKKAQTLSFAEFTSTGTKAEILHLPTGPRERTAEELDRSRLGGGFRTYGHDSSRSRYSNGDDSRFGSSRVYDEMRHERDLAPSRADEIDDWGAGKKNIGGGYERRERGGFLDSHSRADESDDWVSKKSSMQVDGLRYGSSFSRDSSRGVDSDSWGRKKEEGSGSVDSDSWGKKKEEGSGSGGSSDSGRPRLNLQPRTLPVSNGQGVSSVLRSRVSNPFGDARPREEILAQKGQDWKKIDEQLESVKIRDSDFALGGKKSEKWRFGDESGKTVRSWRSVVDVGASRADNSKDDGGA